MNENKKILGLFITAVIISIQGGGKSYSYTTDQHMSNQPISVSQEFVFYARTGNLQALQTLYTQTQNNKTEISSFLQYINAIWYLCINHHTTEDEISNDTFTKALKEASASGKINVLEWLFQTFKQELQLTGETKIPLRELDYMLIKACMKPPSATQTYLIFALQDAISLFPQESPNLYAQTMILCHLYGYPYNNSIYPNGKHINLTQYTDTAISQLVTKTFETPELAPLLEKLLIKGSLPKSFTPSKKTILELYVSSTAYSGHAHQNLLHINVDQMTQSPAHPNYKFTPTQLIGEYLYKTLTPSQYLSINSLKKLPYTIPLYLTPPQVSIQRFLKTVLTESAEGIFDHDDYMRVYGETQEISPKRWIILDYASFAIDCTNIGKEEQWSEYPMIPVKWESQEWDNKGISTTEESKIITFTDSTDNKIKTIIYYYELLKSTNNQDSPIIDPEPIKLTWKLCPINDHVNTILISDDLKL